jgi:Biotin-lipoyl like
MNNNGHEHITSIEQLANGPPENSVQTCLTQPSISERHNGLKEQVDRLRLEIEHLRDEQKALQQTPQSNDIHVGEEVEDEESDDSNARDPGDRGRALHRRPVKLVLALVVATILSVGGLRSWNYLKSYEWTDDAEIDGHLDPISTRINDTVVRVYVENTYQVKAGQPLVDLGPRDYQVAVENAAANLAPGGAGRESSAAELRAESRESRCCDRH